MAQSLNGLPRLPDDHRDVARLACLLANFSLAAWRARPGAVRGSGEGSGLFSEWETPSPQSRASFRLRAELNGSERPFVLRRHDESGPASTVRAEGMTPVDVLRNRNYGARGGSLF